VTPTVSVCIPAYNGERYIDSAVDSVLGQTLTDLELVVVDDGSTDATVDVVRARTDSRLRLVTNEERIGAVANWNRAVAECRGRYVKLLCQDDALAPDCLERQVGALEAPGCEDAVLAAGQRDVVDESGRVLLHARGLAGMRGRVSGLEAMARCVRTGTNVLGEPACVLVRADALRAAGPWSGALPYVIDLDMWFRLLARGDLVAVPGALARFRVHSMSWSTALARDQARQARALFHQWSREPGTRIRRRDELVGAARAELLRVGRRLVYRRPSRPVPAPTAAHARD
jgi:glycosyltransferase involved in cell wall biosynthesis